MSILDNEQLKIKIKDFERPFDVLCHLVDINKYEISNINISEICTQYLDYLNLMESLNMEIASEFLNLASTLIYMKSKKLLPKIEEKEELTPEELLQAIIEYKKYKEISVELRKKYEIFSNRVTKKMEILPKCEVEIEQELTVEDIVNAYKNILKNNEDKINENSKNIEKIAISDKYTVESKVKEMFKELYKNKRFVFNKKYSKEKDKEEIVTAFSGLLELSRRQKVNTYQNEIFSDIVVEKVRRKEK